MSVSDFWDADLRSVYNFISGRATQEQEFQRREWERARWLGHLILLPHKKVKPTDLIKFDWENAPSAEISPEEIQRREAIWEKWDKKMKERHGK